MEEAGLRENVPCAALTAVSALSTRVAKDEFLDDAEMEEDDPEEHSEPMTLS